MQIAVASLHNCLLLCVDTHMSMWSAQKLSVTELRGLSVYAVFPERDDRTVGAPTAGALRPAPLGRLRLHATLPSSFIHRRSSADRRRVPCHYCPRSLRPAAHVTPAAAEHSIFQASRKPLYYSTATFGEASILSALPLGGADHLVLLVGDRILRRNLVVTIPERLLEHAHAQLRVGDICSSRGLFARVSATCQL